MHLFLDVKRLGTYLSDYLENLDVLWTRQKNCNNCIYNYKTVYGYRRSAPCDIRMVKSYIIADHVIISNCFASYFHHINLFIIIGTYEEGDFAMLLRFWFGMVIHFVCKSNALAPIEALVDLSGAYFYWLSMIY